MSAIYRCYFFGPDRKISGFQDFSATEDTEAIAIANTLRVERNAPAFELWQAMRHVHSEGL
jgi:hypothetical protein